MIVTDGLSVAAAEIKSESLKQDAKPAASEKKPGSPAANPERNRGNHKPPYYIDDTEAEKLEGIETKLFITRTIRKEDGSLEKVRVNLMDTADKLYKRIEQANIFTDLATDICSIHEINSHFF